MTWLIDLVNQPNIKLKIVKERYQEAYAAELEHFNLLINDSNTKPLIRPCDPLRTTILADAARQSWLTGEKIIIADLIRKSLIDQEVNESEFWEAWAA